MFRFAVILILSCFATQALRNTFWNSPFEGYEANTCNSTNGTEFCESCGVVVVCLLQGDTYLEIRGSCPSNSSCVDGGCETDTSKMNVSCTCTEPTTIYYQCDAYNSSYYVFCVMGDPFFIKCPDGEEFDCAAQVCMVPPTTTTTTTTTTPAPDPCVTLGVFPVDCYTFRVCTVIGEPPATYTCPDGQFFDPNTGNCVDQVAFNCTTTGSYRDPYDCQRYYVCAGSQLVAYDCCADGFYYNDNSAINACEPNNGDCITVLECSPSAVNSSVAFFSAQSLRERKV